MRRFLSILITALAAASGANSQELQPPQIPDSLTATPERTAYLIEHFWDNMDFADTTMSTNAAFMEQNFAYYASLFPHTDMHKVLPGAASRLLERAQVLRDAYNLLAETADTYLYEPESPVANEEAYRYFLLAITGSGFIDPALRVRYRIQLEDINKNRPGTIATDFEIKTRNGDTVSLLGKCREAKGTLLIFYDPECHDCTVLVNELKQDMELTKAVESGHLNIIAVYPEGDEELFANGAKKIPDGWIDGISPEGQIIEEELYSIRSFPTIYLIDSDGTVLIRNAAPVTAVSEAKKLTL
ncbi:MAG: DUF5106 domain-containing protein [Paramuribaculum sp.]|nr:DUF5106 domain-containing protein [Paramuribaculum sp.]